MVVIFSFSRQCEKDNGMRRLLALRLNVVPVASLTKPDARNIRHCDSQIVTRFAFLFGNDIFK